MKLLGRDGSAFFMYVGVFAIYASHENEMYF